MLLLVFTACQPGQTVLYSVRAGGLLACCWWWFCGGGGALAGCCVTEKMGFVGKGPALVGTAGLEVGISAKEACVAAAADAVGADPGMAFSLLGSETGNFSMVVCVADWLP